MGLVQLEQLFWETARGRLRADAVNDAFVSDARLDAAARMAIYRDMYFARQIDALGDAFPVLKRQLGDDAFQALARAYVLAHPSESPALERFGRKLPELLQARERPRALCDLAQLEWLGTLAMLAPDDPVATATQLAPERWPSARLHLARSIHVANVCREAYATFAGADVTLPASCTVALWRRGHGVRHVVLADDEAAALVLARDGRVFDELCESLGDVPRTYQVMRSWFARHWITRIEAES